MKNSRDSSDDLSRRPRRRMRPEPKAYKKTLVKYVVYLAIILFAMFWLKERAQKVIAPAEKTVQLQLMDSTKVDSVK